MINKQPSGKKSGIYFNLSNEEYHSDPAISCSNIKDLLISPLKYWNNSPLNPDRKRKETAAKSTGTALHCLLMEKEKFKQDYIVLPKLEIDSDFYRKESQNPDFLTKYALRKTKDAKTFEYIGSQTVIKEEDFAEIKAAISSFEAQSAAGALFQGGYAEVSIFWRDEETSLMCKCRHDYLNPVYSCVVDYKSIADIEKINRDIANYKYYIQAPYYLEGLNQFRKMATQEQLKALETNDYRFIFAFQEKESPYLVRLKSLDEDVLEVGRQKFRLGLEIYKENIEKYGVEKWEDNYRRGDEEEIQIMGLVNLPSYIQYM